MKKLNNSGQYTSSETNGGHLLNEEHSAAPGWFRCSSHFDIRQLTSIGSITRMGDDELLQFIRYFLRQILFFQGLSMMTKFWHFHSLPASNFPYHFLRSKSKKTKEKIREKNQEIPRNIFMISCIEHPNPFSSSSALRPFKNQAKARNEILLTNVNSEKRENC